MKFSMDDNEIRSSFKNAKDQHGQIKVLAELNNVPVKVMEDKLREVGFDLPEAPLLREKHIKKNGPSFDKELAKKLFSDGMDDLDIAERLGVSVTAFKTWRRGNGLMRPRIPGKKNQAVDRVPCKLQPPIPPEVETPAEAEVGHITYPLIPPTKKDCMTMGQILVELEKIFPGYEITVNGAPVTGLRMNVHMTVGNGVMVPVVDLEVGGDR